MATKRVLYAKGGRAIGEAERLFPKAGQLPDGGPDKYLLGVLGHTLDASFRLVSFGPETKQASILGRDVVEYGVRPVNVSRMARRWAYLRESLRFLTQTIAWKPTDVLCGIDGPFAVFAFIAARLAGARFVFLAHNALVLPSISRPYRLAHELIVKRADQIVVHGPFLKDQVIALGADERRVIEFNNGLDDNHSQLIEGLLREGEAAVVKPMFLFAGRMEEDKGIFDLLEAFSRLRKQRDAELVFVGTGAALEALRQAAEDSEARDDIRVLGPVPHDEIFSLMRRAAAVVTPTQSRFPEGRCMTVMEAFFVGTPVIAPDYGPFPYLVEHNKNGLLFAADDVVALATALRKIATGADRLALRQGALASGKALMYPSKSFAQAIGQEVFADVAHT